MKKINLLSPIPKEFDKQNNIIAEISHDIFIDNKLGVEIPIIHKVISEIIPNDSGKLKWNIDYETYFGKRAVLTLHEINSVKNYCVQIAEELNSTLNQINDNFRRFEVLKPIFDKLIETKKVKEREKEIDNYPKLGFMGHRYLFSDIIKSNKIEWLNKQVLANYNLKSVTNSFCNFILDRNKYTHGDIMILHPENKTILRYIDKNEYKYTIINKEITESFINCYHELKSILNEVKKYQ